MKIKTFNKLITKSFSQKVYHANSKIIDNKVVSQVENEQYQEINNPVASMLGLLSSCETKSIQYFAKKNNIEIKDIIINLEGTFDYSNFYDKDNSIPNTYRDIKADVTIKYSGEKNREKVESIIGFGIDKCPVASTLRLAGVAIRHNLKYIKV
jgi:uncharacterized OsmC-like protein